MKIRFNQPYVTGKEIEYMKNAILSGRHCGDGEFTKRAAAFFENTYGTKRALLTTSCSSALDMSIMVLDIGLGDEVIMPSFTFVSTANAAALRGAKIVFAEIDDSLNIDLDDVEKKLTSKTKAVIPVHYGSTSCDMDRLMTMSKAHGFYVIEDAAQAVNAKYKDKWLGTIGHMACYSFHETKNVSCGEGGALLINSDEENFITKAEIIREKGTNRAKFFRGEIDKYTWVSIGSSYLLSDILAAHLLAQLEEMDEITRKRKNVVDSYREKLLPLAQKGLFKLPYIPDYNQINYHNFYLLFEDGADRDALMYYLKNHDINAVFHYLPLHTSDMGISMGYKMGDLPRTERVSAGLLRLPLYADMTNKEIETITRKIIELYSA